MYRANRLHIRSILALGSCLALSAAALPEDPAEGSGKNLLVNGSFEEPVVRPGGYQLIQTGQVFPGWEVVGERGNVAPISGRYTAAGIVFGSKDGQQWLDMTGVSNSPTAVRQSVRTLPGMHYELIFHVGNVSGGGFGSVSAIEVLVDGKSLGVATNDLAGGGVQQWGRYRMPIIAARDVTTITFINRDARNDNSNGLDNVMLVENLSGAYDYDQGGSATIRHRGNHVHVEITASSEGGAPGFIAEGKLASNVITGRWHAVPDAQSHFSWVATITPSGVIEMVGSDDPEDIGIKKGRLTLK